MAPRSEPTPEFSRPVEVMELEPGGTTVELTAEPAEREALSRRFDLLELKRLDARVTLKPVGGAVRVLVSGRLEADLAQSCVVTLEPVEDHIVAAFDVVFMPAASLEGEEGGEVELRWDEDDPPEPIVDGRIDLGEVVAERLGLEIEPFPRKPDAEFQGYRTGPDEAESPESGENPFGVLAKLRPNKR